MTLARKGSRTAFAVRVAVSHYFLASCAVRSSGLMSSHLATQSAEQNPTVASSCFLRVESLSSALPVNTQVSAATAAFLELHQPTDFEAPGCPQLVRNASASALQNSEIFMDTF